MSRTASPRRAKAPARRRAAPVTQNPWDPEIAKMFALAAAEWTPPRLVRVTHHTHGWTFEGKFVTEQGHTAVLKTRVRRLATGQIRIVEQAMALRFYVSRKAVAV